MPIVRSDLRDTAMEPPVYPCRRRFCRIQGRAPSFLHMQARRFPRKNLELYSPRMRLSV